MTTRSKTAVKPATEVTMNGLAREFALDGRRVTFVPLTVKRRHTRALLIPPPGAQHAAATSFDLPLLRALGKAFYWQCLIDGGEFANAQELARRLKLEPGWVSEVMRMTLLAPDIVQAILDGRQPRHLNLHAMRGRQVDVPADWQAQRELFGFVQTIPIDPER